MVDDTQLEENRPQSSFWLIWGAAILLLSLGCVAGDRNVSVGEIGVCGESTELWSEGRGRAGYLAFYHPFNGYGMTTDPAYYDFNRYLMEGSFGTYSVSHWDTGEPARIVDVRSSDPDVIAVDTIYADLGSFDVEGLRPGSAEIRVETDAGIADRINLIVTDLARVDFEHCCTYDQTAYYLTDSRIELPVTYFDSYGEETLGFGRFPFHVSDEDNLTWLSSAADPVDLHMRTSEHPGNVTLTPTVAGDPITLEFVTPGELDGVSVHVEPDRHASGLWFVGGVPYRNDTPLCAGKYPMRIESLTPSACQLVTAANHLVSRLEITADETALLEERSSGDCELLVQLLDDAGRVVLEQEATDPLGRSSYSNDYDDGYDFDDWD